MTDPVFEKARGACATRIATAIKTFVDDTPKGKKPDHQTAIASSLIVELTHACARIALLETKLRAQEQILNATNEHIQTLVKVITERHIT